MSKSKIKLLFLNQTMGIGGAETWFAELFTWLNANNVEVEVYTTNPRFQDKLAFLKTHHIPFIVDLIGDWKGFIKGIVLLPCAFLYYGWIVFQYRKTHVLFLSGYIERILGSIWGKIYSMPVVWAEHGPYGDLLDRFGGLTKWFYLKVKPIPEKIIAPSQYSIEFFVKTLKCDPAKMVLIPHALHDVYVDSKTTPKSVISVSRLEPGKGQNLLLQAWAQVIKEVPGAQLTIVGEGDQYAVLHKLIGELKLKPSVKLAGWVQDVYQAIAAAQIVVFPSVWELEGFGMVTLEAMSLKKPLIVFNFGPLPEIVDPKIGVIVPKGNTYALAKAIVQLLKNPRLARSLGDQARKKYLTNFTFDQAGPKYIKLFESVWTKN